MHYNQVGTLVAISGRFVVLDHLSEVEAFSSLHDPLVQGYALDARPRRRRPSMTRGTWSTCFFALPAPPDEPLMKLLRAALAAVHGTAALTAARVRRFRP